MRYFCLFYPFKCTYKWTFFSKDCMLADDHAVVVAYGRMSIKYCGVGRAPATTGDNWIISHACRLHGRWSDVRRRRRRCRGPTWCDVLARLYGDDLADDDTPPGPPRRRRHVTSPQLDEQFRDGLAGSGCMLVIAATKHDVFVVVVVAQANFCAATRVVETGN